MIFDISIADCGHGKFQCLNNECIDSSKRCNGHFDCSSNGVKSGEDELFCGKLQIKMMNSFKLSSMYNIMGCLFS